MDATTGENSTVLKVTLLSTEDKKQNNPTVIQAAIQPLEEKQQHEHKLKSVASINGRLQYTPNTVGIHKTSISIDGRQLYDDRFVFHSRKQDEELMRKILVGIDGKPGEYRDVLLSTVEFEENRRNRKYCKISESGLLTNKYSPNSGELPPDSLKCFKGITARSPLSGLGCSFWVTRLDCKALPSAELNKVAAQVGLCLQEHCDDEIQIARNKHSWCVSVDSCKTHHSLCLKVYSSKRRVCDHPLTVFKPNTKLNITLGLLLDTDNSTLHVINVTTNSLVHSIPNIETSQPLMPVFGVYGPNMFQVQMSVPSSMDLSVDPTLLELLSGLVQT
ncbi:uncharacterized protein LOC121377240 [Gigantopelta aegis]|uniref:uncharacterized protein LOC121377240 n=1 Tax=Gigantopelta aegis TaxID=1735272 RepID=UPI001B8879D6|nr:uncharacterized protein LOC121377240 [Gigantopelta aegis]